MSASRSFRRRMRSSSGEPRLVLVVGAQELWQNGGAIQVLPALRDDLHPELKNALSIRRRASLEGRCACGSEMELDGPLTPGSTVRGYMEHEDDCPATDIAITELVERHGSAS